MMLNFVGAGDALSPSAQFILPNDEVYPEPFDYAQDKRSRWVEGSKGSGTAERRQPA